MAITNSFIGVIARYLAYEKLAVVGIVALFYLLHHSSKQRKSYLFSVLAGILCLITNDVVYWIFRKAGEGETYYRLLWMIPIPLLVAYLLIEIWCKMKNTWQKILFAGICIAGILLNSTRDFSSWIMLPDNIYQLSTEVIMIGDKVTDTTGDEFVVLVDDGTIMYSLREYNAHVTKTKNEECILQHMLAVNLDKYTNEMVAEQVIESDATYVVVKKDKDVIRRQLQEIKLQQILDTPNYEMYYVNDEWRALWK